MKHFNLIFVVFFLAFTISKNIKSEETIKLSDLINYALEENLQIKSAKALLEASMKVPNQVRTLPDPTFMIGLKNVGTKLSIGKEEMSMLDFGITQDIPFPKKLSFLSKIAEKSSEAVLEEYRAVILNVISRLKENYFEYYYIEKSMETLKRTIEFLNQLEKAADVRYQVGKGSQQDIWKAKLEISRLQEKVEILKQIEEGVLSKMNNILNREQNKEIGKPMDFNLTEFKYDYDTLKEIAYKNSPKIKLLERLKEKNELELSLSKLSYYPDFSLTIGYGERGSFDSMWGAYLGIKLPIYFKKKQDFQVLEAKSKLIAAEEEYKNKKREIESDLKQFYLELTTSKKLIDLYKFSIIPQAKGALDSSISGYSVGSIDFLTMVTNALTFLEYELELLRKITNYEKAIAILEEIIGVNFNKEEIK